MGRAGRRGRATRSRWTVYSVASLSLAAILLAAFLFISLVDLGAIGGPVRALLP